MVTERISRTKDLYVFISSRPISYASVSLDFIEILSRMSPLELIFPYEIPDLPDSWRLDVVCWTVS